MLSSKRATIKGYSPTSYPLQLLTEFPGSNFDLDVSTLNFKNRYAKTLSESKRKCFLFQTKVLSIK